MRSTRALVQNVQALAAAMNAQAAEVKDLRSRLDGVRKLLATVVTHLPARFDSPDVLDDARSGGAHDVLKVDARADVVRDDLDTVAHMPRCG